MMVFKHTFWFLPFGWPRFPDYVWVISIICSSDWRGGGLQCWRTSESLHLKRFVCRTKSRICKFTQTIFVSPTPTTSKPLFFFCFFFFLRLLIQAGYDVNIKDYDGWTPLHAAAHWGKDEACRILVENLCDMDVVNKMVSHATSPGKTAVFEDAASSFQCLPSLQGQTAFDVADEDILGYLEELQKKQTLVSQCSSVF